MLKVNNKDTRTTPMVYFTHCSIVSIVNFEYIIAGWVMRVYYLKTTINNKVCITTNALVLDSVNPLNASVAFI